MSGALAELSPQTDVLDGIKDCEVAGERVAAKLHLAFCAALDGDHQDRDRWLADAVAEHAEITRLVVWVACRVMHTEAAEEPADA